MEDRFCAFARNSFHIKLRKYIYIYIYIKFWSESLNETGHLDDLDTVNREFVTVRAVAAYSGSGGKVALMTLPQ